MLICKECNSSRIKTRCNKSFGKKSTMSIVRCKNCGSTNIEAKTARKTYNKRR
jgi:DNA-directed RNA polymerase subunit RPC12/RpoP